MSAHSDKVCKERCSFCIRIKATEIEQRSRSLPSLQASAKPCLSAQWRLDSLSGELNRKDRAAARADFDVLQHSADGRHFVSFQLASLTGSGNVAIASRRRVVGHGWQQVALRVQPAFVTVGQAIGTESSLLDRADFENEDLLSTCSSMTDLLRTNSGLSSIPANYASQSVSTSTKPQSVAWVEDQYQFMAKGDQKTASLQLENSLWRQGKHAGAGRSRLRSLPGVGTNSSQLSVAFVADPCTVQWEVDAPIERPAFKLALVGQLGIASKLPLLQRVFQPFHPYMVHKHALVSKAIWQAPP